MPVAFDAIAGWHADDHAHAFAAFRLSAEALLSGVPPCRGRAARGLRQTAEAAVAMQDAARDKSAARAFFERYFTPWRYPHPGLLTGYYEPVVEARLERSAEFSVPLYRPPAGCAAEENPQEAICAPDRAEIEAGALAGQGLEFVFLADPVAAFFIHVQGSARLRLEDGRQMRIAYAGKSGHAYTSIGRLAVEEGLLPAQGADKAALEAFLKADEERGAALMRLNRSYIFFREVKGHSAQAGPLGAVGAPLTAGRSAAVDSDHLPLHLPLFIDAPPLPGFGAAPFRRLMVAQDVGSAIKGPGRADLFVGTGEPAGTVAGRIQHAGRMIALWPRAEIEKGSVA